MNREKAGQLMRRVAHRDAGGFRGWRGWRALRRLVETGDKGGQAAVDVLWGAWLDDPDDAYWEHLSRWRQPASDHMRGISLVALGEPLDLTDRTVRHALTLPPMSHPIAAMAERAVLLPLNVGNGLVRKELLEAAAGPQLESAELAIVTLLAANAPSLTEQLCRIAVAETTGKEARERIARICRVHGRAPADPVDRAVYFLHTGQPEQYRALDADGSLLATAYRAAAKPERERLRSAMVGLGDLDLTRVLAGGDRQRLSEMSEGERGYLVHHLAEREEWARLWRVVQDLPLGEAVGALPRFGDWRPSGADREVFELLRRLDPGQVHMATVRAKALASGGVAVHRARISFTGRVNAISFAPDAPHLAVGGTQRVAALVDLTTGQVLRRHRGFTSSVGHILHVGGDALIAGERPAKASASARILRCTADGESVLHQSAGRITALEHLRGGALVVGTRAGEVLTGDETGLAPAPWYPRRLKDWPRTIAASIDGERIAVFHKNSITLAHWTAEEPATTVYCDGSPRYAVYTGDVLIGGMGGFGLACWERQPQAGHGAQQPRLRHRFMYDAGLGNTRGIGWLPDRQAFVHLSESGRLTLFRSDSTSNSPVLHQQAPPARPVGPLFATELRVSPEGDFIAVGYDRGVVDLYDVRLTELPRALSSPIGAATVRDLAVVGAAGDSALIDPAVLEALHACLRHRFRFDIEVDASVTLAAGEYEIALSEDDVLQES